MKRRKKLKSKKRKNFISHDWFRSTVVFGLIFVFILWLDFRSIMSLQNLVFKGFSMTTAGFNTIGIILVLDGFALITGQFAAEWLSRRQATRIAVSSVMIILVLLIGVTFGQRILSEDLAANSASTFNTYIEGGEVVSEQTVLVKKLYLTILALIPVATSATVFSLSAMKTYYDLNKKMDELNKLHDSIIEEMRIIQNADPAASIIMDSERKKAQLDEENQRRKDEFGQQ